jgi:hypothetical protein
MRWMVVFVKHGDDNSKKPADFRHLSLPWQIITRGFQFNKKFKELMGLMPSDPFAEIRVGRIPKMEKHIPGNLDFIGF